jgi:hypothetical protein
MAFRTTICVDKKWKSYAVSLCTWLLNQEVYEAVYCLIPGWIHEFCELSRAQITCNSDF